MRKAHQVSVGAGGVDHNDDFVQVLNDFIVCGLPGSGENPSDPVNTCGPVSQGAAP